VGGVMRSSTDPHFKIQEFVKERNKVLLKGDLNELRKFMKKHKMPFIRDNITLRVTLHKSITAAQGLPKEYRQLSKDWLSARGYTSLDDGDLK
jgi:hypothetical protein